MKNGTVKELYDIIIKKLYRDRTKFAREINDSIDEIEISLVAELHYRQAKAKKEYCEDLIEFFEEVRSNL